MVLLDTDVLIDCLRALPAAKQWLESQADERFGIPGIVAMELLVGCRDRTEQRHLEKFLKAFNVVWPDSADFARAFDLLAAYRLASGVGIPDCLIAAMALGRQTPLCTFNRKHFAPFDGLDLREPYRRG